jgi:copper(I)-binding protein
MRFSRLCLLAILAAIGLLLALSPHAATPAGADVVQADGLTIQNAWARASAGGATTGAAYLTVTGGARADDLVAASTPVAATAEVHQTLTENAVMKMRPMPDLPIPAGQGVTLAPGGTHIMLMGLNQPLVAGESFPLTLTFAHAGQVIVDVKVQPLGRATTNGDPMQKR